MLVRCFFSFSHLHVREKVVSVATSIVVGDALLHVVCINDCGLCRVARRYFRLLGEKNCWELFRVSAGTSYVSEQMVIASLQPVLHPFLSMCDSANVRSCEGRIIFLEAGHQYTSQFPSKHMGAIRYH